MQLPMFENISKLALRFAALTAVVIVIGMVGWAVLRVVDQSDHMAKIDNATSESIAITKDTNKIVKSSAESLSILSPEKINGSLIELRERMNALQTQVTDMNRRISDNQREIAELHRIAVK